ncbi:hypothetical protein BN8_00744 [Fibrisoma limi BUZ 3]|uniref:DUF481 domain-containing protein n=1 Tax=Fibrisoma limi BUZ 3 TaxID=1185876 RepID=I2GD24_9BACT|nr:hypothetical protein [Fibrisoma limi]CCH51798.1 hypothetical protein BN8_00744 [Fibrisoma limi BUZ 3]
MKTLLLGLLFLPFLGFAQSVQITQEDLQRTESFLLLQDGSVVRGRIIRQDSTLITVQKRNGESTFIEADQLVRITATRLNEPAVVDLQRPSPYTVFVFKDGTQVEGKFVRRDSTMITVRKRDGRLTYFEPELLLRVDSAQAVAAAPDSGRTFPNRFAAWLLTDQSAFNPEKGRGYYRNVWLAYNEVGYGITSWWSVSGNIVAIPGLDIRDVYIDGLETRLSTKISIPVSKQFRFGLRATYQPTKRYDYYRVDEQWTFHALASIGDSQQNVTIGYGQTRYRNTNGQSRSFVTLGLAQRLTHNLTLVSENAIYPDRRFSDPLYTLSAALRLNRQRHAFDLGVYSFIFQEFYNQQGQIRTRHRFVPLPYIGYNLIIGRP